MSKKLKKILSLFSMVAIFSCCSGTSSFADVLVWNQVNVEHEQRLAKERDAQGALACSLNHALKCIAYGSQPGSWLQIDIIKPLFGPWKVAYNCREYEEAQMRKDLKILDLFK